MEEKTLKAKIRSNMTPEEINRLEAEEAALRAEENSLIANGISPFKVRLPEHLEDMSALPQEQRKAESGSGKCKRLSISTRSSAEERVVA